MDSYTVDSYVRRVSFVRSPGGSSPVTQPISLMRRAERTLRKHAATDWVVVVVVVVADGNKDLFVPFHLRH